MPIYLALKLWFFYPALKLSVSNFRLAGNQHSHWAKSKLWRKGKKKNKHMLYLVTGYYPAQGHQENSRVKISYPNHQHLHIFRTFRSKIPFLCISGNFRQSFHIYSRLCHIMNSSTWTDTWGLCGTSPWSKLFPNFHRKREIRIVNLHVDINNQWVVPGYCSSPGRELLLWKAELLFHRVGRSSSHWAPKLWGIQGSRLEHIFQRGGGKNQNQVVCWQKR